MFWFFILLLILPAFGIISESIIKEYKKNIFGKFGMIFAMSSIAIIGFFVWSHRMFTTGIDISTRIYFTTATAIIGIPTGIKIFSWLASMYSGRKGKGVVRLYIKVFILFFTFGGITGIMMSNAAIDLILHDTYFIVGHFHTILSIGAVIGIKLGIEIWNRYLIGYKRNVLLSKIEFFLFSFGAFFTFLPFHFLGLYAHPRRYPDYPIMYKKWHIMATIGGMIIMIGVFLYLYIFYKQFKDKILDDIEFVPSFNNSILPARSLDVLLPIPSSFHLFPNSPLLLS